MEGRASMSKFFISFKKMLKDYAVKITVYPYKKPSQGKLVGGIYIDDGEEDQPAPEERLEPVVPVNSTMSQLGTILSGGTLVQCDFLWVSTGEYPVNTVVDIPSQGGKYKVISLSNYHDYSDVTIYQLKGDDLNQDDTSSEDATS